MDPRLEKLASLYGIAPGYHDVWGQWRATSENVHRALLAAMGVETGSAGEIEAALAAREREPWKRVVPAVTVLRAAGLGEGIHLNLPEELGARTLTWRLSAEDDGYREEHFDPLALAPREDSAPEELRVRALTLPVPARAGLSSESTITTVGMVVVIEVR